MFNPTTTWIATLVALPAILGQGTGNTAPENNASPSDSAPFTPTNFTPVIVSGTTCGTTQENLNQCITKVGKDISSCRDNTCLCQTYANIAACYNGCPELVDQGKQYQDQSAQYCSIAGVKANTTATVTTPAAPAPTTTTTTTTTTTANTTPVRTNNTSNTSSNAGTFSAAKGSAAISDAHVSTVGLLAALATGTLALCL